MKILTYTVVLAILSFFIVSCSDENNDDVTNGVSDSGYTQDNETTKEPVRCKDGIETLQINWYINEKGRSTYNYETESGIEYCPNASWHRYEAVDCMLRDIATINVCPADYYLENEPGWIEGMPCLYNSDCTERKNGRCIVGGDTCTCWYECTNDSDCQETEACFCSAGGYSGDEGIQNQIRAYNKCVPANCKTDDDCDGYRCGVSELNGNIGSADDDGIRMGLYCHTKEDKCNGDSDCGDTPQDVCVYNIKSGYWVCSERGED